MEKEAANVFGTWADLQMKVWNDWLRGMQGIGASEPSKVWQKTVEAWEQSIKKGIDAQTELAQLWAQNFHSVKDSPGEVAEWGRQGQEMITQWSETQKQLWDGWFQVVKKLNPAPVGENWEQEGQRLVRTWQDMFQKAMDMQTQWMGAWTGGAAGERKKQ
jgi:hypothetical protein